MKLLQIARRSFTQLTTYESQVMIETVETQKQQAILRMKVEKLKELQQKYIKMA